MMFNTNVGDMPIDIFGDYISDCLGEEWTWEYLVFAVNDNGYGYRYGNGSGYGNGIGFGDGYGDGYENGYGNGYGYGIGYGHGHGCNHKGSG